MKTHLNFVFKGEQRGNGLQNVKINEEQGVVYLTFPMLERTGLVRHGFSTRLGGVSEGIFSSMNLSFQRGDDEERVRENYERMAAALGGRVEDMVCGVQTHTTNVRVVTAEDKGKGVLRPQDYEDVDGLVTNEPGIMLVTFHADCVPVYLVDVKERAIAMLHAGWRGTVGRIGQHALWIMKEQYGTEPENVIAVIGPSICVDCYEVGGEVVAEFEREFGTSRLVEMVRQKGNGKYLLDLWRANEIVLREAGVLAEHIQISGVCTCCNPKLLFSHRASQGKRGNLAAFLELL